ncbi:MAG: hypothetical protein GY845_35475 [Planctomycetes bacterium]|nr:hypothetical protein [Planctomycetota bacterium]
MAITRTAIVTNNHTSSGLATFIFYRKNTSFDETFNIRFTVVAEKNGKNMGLLCLEGDGGLFAKKAVEFLY